MLFTLKTWLYTVAELITKHGMTDNPLEITCKLISLAPMQEIINDNNANLKEPLQ